ncbi:hypothetical protein MUK42_28634 [Musa troglodytarum]|uniref:Uncharacterized protein n=1 Tax=Musa troglodytarum TaxID=320322 RepID=A0A9E7F0T4_9LILI|nr:hypothetical protein MUK42_28634 [Musa troglodytarum]
MEGRRGGGVKPWATILEPGGNRWWEIGDVVGGTEGDSTEGVKSGRTVSWLSSQERHLNPSLQLYSSFGWRFLICHADFLTLAFPFWFWCWLRELVTAIGKAILGDENKS